MEITLSPQRYRRPVFCSATTMLADFACLLVPYRPLADYFGRSKVGAQAAIKRRVPAHERAGGSALPYAASRSR